MNKTTSGVANKGLNFRPPPFFLVESGFIAHLGVLSSAGSHTLPETGRSVDSAANSSSDGRRRQRVRGAVVGLLASRLTSM